MTNPKKEDEIMKLGPIPFVLERETKGALRYQEIDDAGKPVEMEDRHALHQKNCLRARSDPSPAPCRNRGSVAMSGLVLNRAAETSMLALAWDRWGLGGPGGFVRFFDGVSPCLVLPCFSRNLTLSGRSKPCGRPGSILLGSKSIRPARSW